MITLHRLSHSHDAFVLNADHITTVEACPDTVVGLTTGVKILVTETPEEVVAAAHAWRASLLAAGLRAAGPGALRRQSTGLALVRATAGDARPNPGDEGSAR